MSQGVLGEMNSFPTGMFDTRFSESRAQPSTAFEQQWPSTVDAALSGSKKNRAHPGSGGEVEINNQALILKAMPNGAHLNITDGDLLLTVHPELMPSSNMSTPTFNLTDANLYLKDKFEEAMKVVFPKIPKEAQTSLLIAPTHSWPSLSYIANGLTNPRDRRVCQTLCFLTQMCIETYFNFYGFARDAAPGTALDAIAVARGGVVDSVKNYWGNGAVPGTNLFLVRKRIFHARDKRFLHYAFVPVATFTRPSQADTAYADVTDHIQFGSSIYVGKIIRWVENVDYSPDILSAMHGFNNPRERKSLRSPGSIRVRMQAIAGLKTNFVP